MKSFIFILTTWAGGGTEKVFENIAEVIYKNFSGSQIFLFVINGFNLEKYLALQIPQVAAPKCACASVKEKAKALILYAHYSSLLLQRGIC